jgi:hypothetical protein
MSRCFDRCATYRMDSIANAWIDIRYNFGPIEPVGSDTYQHDILEWTIWATANGVDTNNANKFGKWLIWLCNTGTVNYGNLPSNKHNEHTGISCAPCPFDSISYDEIRSESWLGYIPTSLSDHANFYMKVAYHGSWGMECTYSGCTYLIEYGRPYFHV